MITQNVLVLLFSLFPFFKKIFYVIFLITFLFPIQHITHYILLFFFRLHTTYGMTKMACRFNRRKLHKMRKRSDFSVFFFPQNTLRTTSNKPQGVRKPYLDFKLGIWFSQIIFCFFVYYCCYTTNSATQRAILIFDFKTKLN